MKKPLPLIREYMSPAPQTISFEKPVRVAKQIMSELGIRHLPVIQEKKVVGLVSDRDIRLLEFWGVTDLEEQPIREAMTPDPYSVRPDIPLVEVLHEMVEKGYGSALIKEGENILGIFTTIDALHVLYDMFKELEKENP